MGNGGHRFACRFANVCHGFHLARSPFQLTGGGNAPLEYQNRSLPAVGWGAMRGMIPSGD
jgi:hypothetical protein